MPVVSVVVDEATVRALDDIVSEMSVETGFTLTRSDILKQAIREFLLERD